MSNSDTVTKTELIIGGIVLAGGRSSRIKRSKPWLPFGDECLLQRTVRMLFEIADPVVVAAQTGQPLPPLPADVTIVHDEIPSAGPLLGLAAGLKTLRSRCDVALVSPCDHPFLSVAFLRHLVLGLGRSQAIVCRSQSHLFPLLGAYRIDTIALLEPLIASGQRSARRFVSECNAAVLSPEDLCEVDPHGLAFLNINDEDDYQRALALVE